MPPLRDLTALNAKSKVLFSYWRKYDFFFFKKTKNFSLIDIWSEKKRKWSQKPNILVYVQQHQMIRFHKYLKKNKNKKSRQHIPQLFPEPSHLRVTCRRPFARRRRLGNLRVHLQQVPAVPGWQTTKTNHFPQENRKYPKLYTFWLYNYIKPRGNSTNQEKSISTKNQKPAQSKQRWRAQWSITVTDVYLILQTTCAAGQRSHHQQSWRCVLALQ